MEETENKLITLLRQKLSINANKTWLRLTLANLKDLETPSEALVQLGKEFLNSDIIESVSE